MPANMTAANNGAASPLAAFFTNQLCFFVSIGWITLAALPYGWRSFYVMDPVLGIADIFCVYFGLYQCQIKLGFAGKGALTLAIKAAEKFPQLETAVGFIQMLQDELTEGNVKMTLMDFAKVTKYVAQVHQNAIYILYSSMVLMGSIGLCVIFLVLGAFFFHYYEKKPTEIGRRMGYRFLLWAPLIITLGLGQYTAFTLMSDFQFLGASSAITFDFSFFIAMGLWLFTWFPYCAMSAFGKPNPWEEPDEDCGFVQGGCAAGGYGAAPDSKQQGMEQGYNGYTNPQAMQQPYQGGAGGDGWSMQGPPQGPGDGFNVSPQGAPAW